MEGPEQRTELSVTELSVGVDVAAVTFTASWLTPGGKPTAPMTLAQSPAGYTT